MFMILKLLFWDVVELLYSFTFFHKKVLVGFFFFFSKISDA